MLGSIENTPVSLMGRENLCGFPIRIVMNTLHSNLDMPL